MVPNRGLGRWEIAEMKMKIGEGGVTKPEYQKVPNCKSRGQVGGGLE